MNNNPDREEQIFDAALQIPEAAARAAYLDRACGADAALRERIELLLKSHEETANPLDQPPVASAKTIVVSPALMTLTEMVGLQIGRYKLLEKIGEGGCGVVYVAEQEKPVRRRVALKIVKLGMDTRQVVARFEAERQALALMDHPNIAKVLDGGATENGRPYFVMELVRGIRITEYCDKNNLSTEERLKLFIQVCKAVQHAHQKGIIHRDIKPSNVLVTLHDGVPVPKVIDFGIAKATNDQRLTDKTVYTAFEQFIGTPAYMSPEQAEMSGLDIDTRSDIYSLGVLLYELLTGRTPFDHETLLREGIDRMRQIIREQEPPRPSTALITLTQADLTTVANHRRVEPPKLVHAIRGDLDWIVMKLLEKDRTRRHESANGVAADIQRHLDNEPVIARPPSQLYRLQKMVRRNKLAVAFGSAVLLVALVALIGLSISSFFWRRSLIAEQNQRIAEMAQHRAELKDESNEAISHATDLAEEESSLPENLVKAESLYRKALAIRADLFGTNSVQFLDALSKLELVLRQRVNERHHREELVAIHREILRINQNLFGEQSSNCVNALYAVANDLDKSNRDAAAEEAYREIVAITRKFPGKDGNDLIQSLGVLGDYLVKKGNLSEAESSYREALGVQRANKPQDVELALYILLENSPTGKGVYFFPPLESLADTLFKEGKLPEAEALYREVVALSLKPPQPSMVLQQPQKTIIRIIQLGEILRAEGKNVEANLTNRDAMAIMKKDASNGEISLINDISEFRKDHRIPDWENEGEKIINEFLSLDDKNLDPTELLIQRADLRAEARHFKAASEDFTKFLELTRDKSRDGAALYSAAMVFLKLGDMDGYSRCLQISRTNDFSMFLTNELGSYISWFWNPKTALLFLKPDSKLGFVTETTNLDSRISCIHDFGGYFLTMGLTNSSGDYTFAYDTHEGVPCGDCTLKGLAEYRQGHFSNALNFAQRALRYDEEAVSYAVLALAQIGLGNTNEARTALAQGKELNKNSKEHWSLNLAAEILLDEARSLIEKRPLQPVLSK